MAVAALDRSADEIAADVVHAYAADVLSGRIVANRYVRLLCERHERWLEREDIWFDAAAGGRAIRFFSYLRLHEGEFEGKPFVLQGWEAFIVGSTFGWFTRDEDGVDVRLIRNAYTETAKGSGKTPMAAGIGLYGMVGEGRSGAQIYSAAAGRDQSSIAWNDARLMVAKSSPLRERIRMFAHSLSGPKGSSFTYVSSEAKNLHGKRVYIAIIDEEHAHPSSEVIDAMRAGTKGWRDALIFRITNSGFDRHSVCWADHQYSIEILEGVRQDDSWFPFVAGLDACEEHRRGGAPVDGCPDCDQWTDESVWLKANPNLGVSVSTRYLREMVREALGKPAQQNVVKRMCFCIWTEGSGKWLDVVTFVACAGGPAELAGRKGWGGLDLSSTMDLTAFVLKVDRDACAGEGHGGRCYDLVARFWLPAANMPARVKRDHVPYDVWARDDWITLTGGNRVDQEKVVADVVSLGAHIWSVGIDRWNTAWLTPALQSEGVEVVEVGQGYASLSAPAKRLEADIAGGLVHYDGNPVLAWMVANAAADEDAAGNIKPSKEKSSERIDGVAAWCDALFAEANGPEVEPEEPMAEPFIFFGGDD